MAMKADDVYAILNKRIKNGGATDEQIQNAVNQFLIENPIQPGATEEQEKQIEDNKTNIEQLQSQIGDLTFGINEEKKCLTVTYNEQENTE